ncbi:MAG: PQQ-dependent sugar dehydrogenase [Chloracidobacterium sp.]|nr:PQQ-dependent sugar dehydrogenase [Chloracidobacterium sp.]
MCRSDRFAEGQVFETKTKDVRFQLETVASGLEVPWGFAWLPNKDLFFTERPGRVRIIQKGKLRAEPVFIVPGCRAFERDLA